MPWTLRAWASSTFLTSSRTIARSSSSVTSASSGSGTRPATAPGPPTLVRISPRRANRWSPGAFGTGLRSFLVPMTGRDPPPLLTAMLRESDDRGDRQVGRLDLVEVAHHADGMRPLVVAECVCPFDPLATPLEDGAVGVVDHERV